MPWFDVDELHIRLDIHVLNIDNEEEEDILCGELNAYLVNEIVDGEYKNGMIVFGKSAAYVKRRLPGYTKWKLMAISALPKITDIIL
uniref:Uncharacterized protein n=1 Tax=virus sp. ctDJ83 TaxID=2827625 RepID=A0A8S5RJ04_9VIRU|nr:MAG TPA: hypothetical protein [virus sp. ctDJ83]